MTCRRYTAPVSVILLTLFALATAVSAPVSSDISVSDLEVYASRYQPDPIDYAGSIFIHLRNTTNRPIAIEKISLNGDDIGKVWQTTADFLKPDVRDDYIKVSNDNTMWYRVFPNPLPPHGMAEIIIRLAPAACGQAVHTISIRTTDGDNITVLTDSTENPVSLEYVGVEAAMDVLHVYMQGRGEQRPSASIIEVDGEPVEAAIHPVYSGVSYAKVTLAKPWDQGTLHTIAVRNANGRIAATVRALPSPPPLAIMGNISDPLAETYYEHLFDAHIAFTPGVTERYAQLAAHRLCGAYPYRRYLTPEAEKKEPVYYDDVTILEGIAGHPGLWAYFLEDEPDGRYHNTDLSGEAISRDVERANQFCRILDPQTPTYLQIDHGGYPRNLYTFGQIPDYLCTHAYALGGPIVASTSDHVMHSQAASKPAPFLYLNEGYSAVRGGDREFEPDEMRMEVYTALAGGAKSLQWYPAHGGNGLLAHPRMWNAVGEMNITLQAVLPLLSTGSPVGKPIVQDGDYLASTILCGDSAIVAVLVNREFDSTPTEFVRPETHPTTVRVRMPLFLKAAKVMRIQPDGPPVEITATKSASSITYEAVASPVDMVVICADEGVAEELVARYSVAQKRFKPSPEPR